MIHAIRTGSRTEMIDITDAVRGIVADSGIVEGVCMLFVPHTTAGVTINENADPSVREDILSVLNRVVPWEAGYRHREGNSPAHIKASLVGASALVEIEDGRLALGTWQGIFFCEFDGPRQRKIRIRLLPQSS